MILSSKKGYRSWTSIKSLCYNKNNKRYHKLGGKGIIVCDRWKKSFINFYNDMGERPGELCLLRIDDEKNFTPENCIWGIKKGNTRHDMSRTPEIRSWQHMKGRCYNENDKKYPRYGGRGIKVCDKWLESFENFYEDMGDRPPRTSLDREDNDGNYEPGNCRWATSKQQSNNMSSNVILTLFDISKNITEWSEILEIPSTMIRKRKKRGWTDEKTLTTQRYANQSSQTMKQT
jgi:hypothetical protein